MGSSKTTTVNDWPEIVPTVYMGGDFTANTIRAAVVHASTIFYNTPATISPEVEHLTAMAAKYKVYLVMGVIEKDGYTLYSTVLFFNSLGDYLGKHQKIMPTGFERIILGYGDGSTIPVYDTPIGKIGAAISWENRMPLLRTAKYAKGIEIYCAPTTAGVYRAPTIDGFMDVGKESMTHIALEGGCFVLSANQFCGRRDYPPQPDYVFSDIEAALKPDFIICSGGSMIISPSGVVLAGPSYEQNVVLSAVLDCREIARAKHHFDVVGNYARPEVFSLIVRDHPMSSVSFASTSTLPESPSK